MKITDLSKQREIVWKLKQDDFARATNRAAINHEFNGGSPYTSQEAEENGILTNVQPLMAPRLAHDARRQLDRSRNATGSYFNLSIDYGPVDQQEVLSRAVSRIINKQLREDTCFGELLRGMDANMVLHGRGPVIWDDDMDPIPKCLSIEDIKLPTDTYVDFSNLSHFAVYMPLSAAELMDKVSRKRVNPGWNVKYVKQVIEKLTKDVLESIQQDDEFPEKLAEDIKQNSGYYASDRVPTAKCWAFFQRIDEKNDSHWEMSIFEDPAISGDEDKVSQDIKKLGGEFLFKQKTGFVKDIKHLLHCQYADGSNVPPFKYHTVRGLGYLLYPVMRLFDRYFCRSMDAYFEACNQLFRNVGEEDRERLQHVQLANFSVLPVGVQYVPANERYTVNHNVMNAAFGMLRQLIQENSASFTQDQDSGTAKEMTATEAMARVQQATALVSSMLAMQSFYRQHFFNEICRRYCIPNNRSPMVKAFRDKARKLGIPDEALDFDLWDVRVDSPIGGGNKTIELAQTGELFAARAAFPPAAQRVILKDFLLARKENPQEVEAMMPSEMVAPSQTQIFATLAIGSLLQGSEIAVPDSVNLDEYAGVLMNLLGARIQQIAESGQTPSAETVLGMQQTIQHIYGIIQQIAQDPEKTQAMGGAEKALKAMAQQVEAWAGQIQQQSGQAQLTPEAQSKIISSRILAENAAQIKSAQAQQKMAQRQEQHTQKLAQQQVELQASIEEQDLRAANDMRSEAIMNAAKAKAVENKPQPKQDKK